jgi:SAM-dependent methyltransferase
MILRMFNKAAAIVRREGILGLTKRMQRRARFAVENFDQAHGVSTSGHVDLWKLNIPSEDWTLGTHYRPISEQEFSNAMKFIPHRAFTFVDVGSGKGRALILAKESGFKRLIGVEFSPELCKSAKENLQKLDIDAEIACQSAATFDFPLEPSVVFMYNPFGQDVMSLVLPRIRCKGFLVYVNPHCEISLPLIHQEPCLSIFAL